MINVARMAKLQFSLHLVKCIPNFTPAHAITYTKTICTAAGAVIYRVQVIGLAFC